MENQDHPAAAMAQQPHLPPGFRFHPTDEELVVHYLKRKTAAAPLPVAIIADIDIYKFDPWELPEKAIFGEQEWYFFTPRERKYPNGARPNRAATSGYWKATGTDKPVLTSGSKQKVGVKKALVFYGGKPPKGIKTNWIMHEYRLPENKALGHDFGNKKPSLRLDDWVLCRIYKKSSAVQRPEDQDKDEINSNTMMMSSMSRGLSIPFGQHMFVSDNQNMYERMMMIKTSSGSQSIPQLDYFNSYCDEEHGDGNLATTKRFFAENFVEKPDNERVNLVSTMLEVDRMAGQNPLHGNSIGEGGFGQQFLGLNWYK